MLGDMDGDILGDMDADALSEGDMDGEMEGEMDGLMLGRVVFWMHLKFLMLYHPYSSSMSFTPLAQ